MTTKVRASKFRHVVGNPMQLRDTYGDINAGSVHTDSEVVKATASQLAIPWAATGSVCIVQLDKPGTVPEETPLIYHVNDDGDKVKINELNWCPNNDELLATAGNDGTCAIWKVPSEGLTADLTTPECLINASEKRLLYCGWHPTASGVVVTSAADKSVSLFDVEAGGSEMFKLPNVHKGLLCGFAWNKEGSLLATHCKDKKLRIFDPRSNETVAEVADHPSPKGSHLSWMGNRDRIVTAGHIRGAERQMAVYDPRNMAQKLWTHKLNPSSASMYLFNDDDTDLLFMAPKGDGSITIFEEDDQGFHELTTFKATKPQNGLCMLPKSNCNVMANEIVRFIKLSGNRCEPIRFEVPRAQSGYFQDDLFPPTWDRKATMSAAEWQGGANNPRSTVSLEPSS